MAKKKSAPRSTGKAVKKAPAPKKKSMPTKAKTAKPAKKATAIKKVAAKNAPAAKKALTKKPAVKAAPAKGKKAVAQKPAPAKKVVVKKVAPAKKVAKKATPPKKATPDKKVGPVKAAPPAPKPVVKAEVSAPKATAPAPDATPTALKPAPPKAPPAKKRPGKEKVVMEFYLNSTPTALYDQISTPSGFSEWYCQDVDVRGDQYTFSWEEGEVEETTLIGRKLGEVIRFRRNDEEDTEAFFEFRIRVDAMTNEVALVVTDFAWPHEVDETRNLWASQIHALMRVLGA